MLMEGFKIGVVYCNSIRKKTFAAKTQLTSSDHKIENNSVAKKDQHNFLKNPEFPLLH